MDLKAIHDVAETIGGFSAAFAALAVIVAILAHRKTSRDKAIEILLEWTRHFATIDPLLLNLAWQIEDHGTDEQIQALASKKPFQLKPFQEDIFSRGMHGHKTEIPQQGTAALRVEFGDVVRIRAAVVSYLNMIECALAAAHHTSANTDIIHRQFASFYDPKTGKAVFQRFRNAPEGKTTYPCIQLFEDKLREQHGCHSDPVYQAQRLQRRLTSTFAPIDQKELDELRSALSQKLTEFKKWTDVAASLSLLKQVGVSIDSSDFQLKWADNVSLTEIKNVESCGLTNRQAVSILTDRLRIRNCALILPEILRRVLTGQEHPGVLCKQPWLDANRLSEVFRKSIFKTLSIS